MLSLREQKTLLKRMLHSAYYSKQKSFNRGILQKSKGHTKRTQKGKPFSSEIKISSNNKFNTRSNKKYQQTLLRRAK